MLDILISLHDIAATVAAGVPVDCRLAANPASFLLQAKLELLLSMLEDAL